MKHVINILVLGILVYFAIALSQFIDNCPKDEFGNIRGLLWFPLLVFMYLWGYKLYQDYE